MTTTPPDPAGQHVLPCPLAGRWYPEDPDELRAAIARWRPARIEAAHTLCGLLVPHAGYDYSGRVAMTAFARIPPDRFDRVIVMGPSHYVGAPDRISLPDATHYSSPLGVTELDRVLLDGLRDAGVAQTDDASHAQEHSVRIQVPLLQSVLGTSFRLAPLVLGRMGPDAIRRFAEALRPWLDARTLVVASSDFTHFGERFGYVPFRENIPERIETLDRQVSARILANDPVGLRRVLDATQATVCGRDPIEAWLTLLPSTARIESLAYDTSGRQTGDWTMSVSYMSMAAHGTWNDPRPGPSAAVKRPELDDADRGVLLRLARRSLQYAVASPPGTPAPTPEQLSVTLSPGTRRTMGGFVTLTLRGALRGCIGEITPSRPIWQVVIDHAANAALRDPRFPPVCPPDLDAIHLEISALGPPRPVPDAGHIALGRHGIVLSKQGRQAVFLPHVPTEQGWDLETTLTQLSLKAGLGPNAWREAAGFQVFEAEVF